jgi:hypothetical protein
VILRILPSSPCQYPTQRTKMMHSPPLAFLPSPSASHTSTNTLNNSHPPLTTGLSLVRYLNPFPLPAAPPSNSHTSSHLATLFPARASAVSSISSGNPCSSFGGVGRLLAPSFRPPFEPNTSTAKDGPPTPRARDRSATYPGLARASASPPFVAPISWRSRRDSLRILRDVARKGSSEGGARCRERVEEGARQDAGERARAMTCRTVSLRTTVSRDHRAWRGTHGRGTNRSPTIPSIAISASPTTRRQLLPPQDRQDTHSLHPHRHSR